MSESEKKIFNLKNQRNRKNQLQNLGLNVCVNYEFNLLGHVGAKAKTNSGGGRARPLQAQWAEW